MILYVSFRNLFRNTRRTIAVLLTIALGSAALFSFKGFINGILVDYRESTIHAHYGHGQFNEKGYRETVYEKPWQHWVDYSTNIKNSFSQLDEVKYVFPRVTFSALLKKGNLNIGGRGQGVDAVQEAAFFHGLEIIKGKALYNEPEGILLGKGLAQALKVQPGDVINLYTHSTKNKVRDGKFTVTGIFYTGSLDFDNHVFRIQLPAAQKLMDTQKIESISVGLDDYRSWEKVATIFEKKFPHLEGTPFNILDKVYYQHSVDWLNTQFSVVQIIIMSMVLLGIFNTISTSILERKREIGNLRANGESIFDIMKLILAEGAFMGLIGTLLGTGISYALLILCLHNGITLPPGPGLTNEMFISFKFTWRIFFEVFGLSFFIVLLASIMAGVKVAKMPIAKALRSI